MGRLEKIRQHYVSRLVPGQPNYRILDWAGPDTQAARFDVLLRHVPLAGRSLLDVGCGLGDLAGYLRRRGLLSSVRYTGLDVVEELLLQARRDHPTERFLHADLFSDSPSDTAALGEEKFDVVFCSGALNLNLGNNLEFLPRAMQRMIQRARETVAVNFLRARDVETDPTYFFYRPDEVRAIVQPLVATGGVEIIEDYLPNDFTVLCRLNEKATSS